MPIQFEARFLPSHEANRDTAVVTLSASAFSSASSEGRCPLLAPKTQLGVFRRYGKAEQVRHGIARVGALR